MGETRTRRSVVKHVPRAVFDSNVYIAFLLSKNLHSPSRELFQLLKAKKYDLLWCEPIRMEVVEKAISKGIPDKRVASFLADLYICAKEIDLSSVVIQRLVADDSDDDFVLACALESKAQYLVSYDSHLLNLGPVFRGIRILDSLHFLYILRGDKPPR